MSHSTCVHWQNAIDKLFSERYVQEVCVPNILVALATSVSTDPNETKKARAALHVIAVPDVSCLSCYSRG